MIINVPSRRIFTVWRGLRASHVTFSVCVLAAILLLWNLPYSPRTWFDEGSHLHVPKTLLHYGVYADISSEGFRYYGPTVGIGPTVMLPVALSFWLFGVGLVQARLVIVAYALLALGGAWLLARRLHGPAVAALGLLMLVATRTVPFDGLLEYGRQVLGEAPGMAWLFLGTAAWVRGVQQGTGWRWAILSGLGFGLALVTKNQFALIVPPALVLATALDLIYYRSSTWQMRTVPLLLACGCFGVWMLAQLLFLGPGSLTENLHMTRQAAGGAIFVFSRDASLKALAYILRPDLLGGLLLPALAAACWRARQRTTTGLAEALPALFISLWLVWYVGASLGWPRYAFPAVAFGALAVARLIHDIWRWLVDAPRAQALRWPLAAYVALAVLLPLGLSARAVAHPDTTAHDMAAFLNAHVPRNVVIETWEPEMGALTDHTFHYPPIALLDTLVRHTWLGGPAIEYDWDTTPPAYVLVGPFGDASNIYYTAEDILNTSYTKISENGPYSLYRLQTP